MAYVIRKTDGSQTRSVYPDAPQAIAALRRTRAIGAQAWWCKYGRQTKMLIATRTPDGIEWFAQAGAPANHVN